MVVHQFYRKKVIGCSRKFGFIGQRMGSLRYIQNYSLKLNDYWHWWMVMLSAMPVEILTAKLNSLSKNTNK